MANRNFLVRVALGLAWFVPGTNPGFLLILHSGSPACPRDKRSLSLDKLMCQKFICVFFAGHSPSHVFHHSPIFFVLSLDFFRAVGFDGQLAVDQCIESHTPELPLHDAVLCLRLQLLTCFVFAVVCRCSCVSEHCWFN